MTLQNNHNQNQYTKKITNIKNEKIKNSLLELNKLFKKK